MTTERMLDVMRHRCDVAYAEHVIEQRGPSEWYCHRPGTSCYHYSVAVVAGSVVVVGDGVTMVLEPYASGGDVVGWIRAAIGSPGYMLSKASHHIPVEEWSESLAKEAFTDEWPTMPSALREALASNDGMWTWDDSSDDESQGDKPTLDVETGDEWYRAWWENSGMEPPDCNDYTMNAARAYHALRHFVRLLNAKECADG